MEIPFFLQQILEENNFVLEDVLQISKWKKTFVLKVSKHENIYLVKALDKEAPNRIKKGFLKEVIFYSNGNNKNIPKLVMSADNLIVTNYIEGITLREFLLNNQNDILGITQNLISGINSLYDNNKKITTSKNTYSIAYANIVSLTLSGSIQTKELSIIHKGFNKILLFWLKLKLKRVISTFNEKDLKSGFAHGDFHYNNIFITRNNEIKFIDFENSDYNQAFDFDIIYLLVMIEIRIKDIDRKNAFKWAMMSMFENYKHLMPVYKLYKVAATINSRFSGRPLSLCQKISIFAKSN